LTQVIRELEEAKMQISEFNERNLRRRIDSILRSLLGAYREISLTPEEREEVLREGVAYFLGLGPIEVLLKDPEITEIMINGPREVYVEKKGNVEPVDTKFKDEEQLMYFVEKMLATLGRQITHLEPYVDTILNDGSRVNIVKQPVSRIGPIVTIRKFSNRILTMDELIASGALDQGVAEFLKACVIARLNILLSGGAGAGKTTLMNILSSYIPARERSIVIEDTPELNIPGKHALSLVTRAPNIEGKGEITIRNLIRNALHMRPDRIIVGEVRSDEVIDMIQAMNTGHEGSMTTLHANSPADALDRLQVLTLLGRANISDEVAWKMVVNTIHLVIHMARLSDGTRRIITIGEVTKSLDSPIEDIFVFDEAAGALKATGRMPGFYSQLKKKADYSQREFER
jgi:pilus assembly protein CpaF